MGRGEAPEREQQANIIPAISVFRFKLLKQPFQKIVTPTASRPAIHSLQHADPGPNTEATPTDHTCSQRVCPCPALTPTGCGGHMPRQGRLCSENSTRSIRSSSKVPSRPSDGQSAVPRLKGHRFDSQSGHMPRFQVRSLVGVRMGGNQSMFLFHALALSLSPPLSPSSSSLSKSNENTSSGED